MRADAVRDAWDALEKAEKLQDVTASSILQAAKDETRAEIARCQAMPPKFSKDSRIALIRIHSPCQVHPVIATRWSGTLKNAKRLVAVMVLLYASRRSKLTPKRDSAQTRAIRKE